MEKKNSLRPSGTAAPLSWETLRERFLAAALELQEIAKTQSCRILATNDNRLPLFRKLPFEKQVQVVEILEKSRDIYRAMMHDGRDIQSSASVVWYALNHLELVPPSNFFDKIGGDDVVQIYSDQGFHQFANFKFFEVCSYTMEQVYSLPWPELWHREPQDLARLQACIAQALGPQQEAVALTGLSHKVTEIASVFKLEMIYTARGITPIWKKNPRTKAGFMIVEHAQLLNAPLPTEEQQLLENFLVDSQD